MYTSRLSRKFFGVRSTMVKLRAYSRVVTRCPGFPKFVPILSSNALVSR